MTGLVLVLAGCGDADPLGGGGTFSLAQYFDGATAWTWRDDGDTGDVDDSEVLRGEIDEEGTIEVRRGSRYADGVPVGRLSFLLDTSDMVLASWEWGDAGSGSATILARGGGTSGDVIANVEGSCLATASPDRETSYGTFGETLRSDCTGTNLPDGAWWFAPGFGPVRVETEVITLDLVAPR